ncbi:hypothetical protein ACHAO2_004004 [Verticillium nonalfalfae]
MDSTTQEQQTIDGFQTEKPDMGLKNTSTQEVVASELFHEENFFTRYGLNLASFKKGHYGKGSLELKRPMQARHLNMIAIGGAIGAGFFVGSGRALSSVALLFLNLFGGIGYAEEEFWASLLKIITISTFMVISVVLICGGGPSSGRYDDYWGTRLWQDPGPFRYGFRGFCSVFVTAAFSFNGSELVGLAAAESKNPTKALPSAIKQVFWRVTLFYVLGLSLIGLLIRSDDPRLISESAYADVSASPFVLVGLYAGLRGYDHFINAVILISVLSVGMSCVFGGSRTLTALAQQGYAPEIFTYIDRSGRPLASTIFMLAFGPLAYVNLSTSGPVVFDWLLALGGLAATFSWGSICLAHIRFRQAWSYHGHTLDEIPFQALRYAVISAARLSN